MSQLYVGVQLDCAAVLRITAHLVISLRPMALGPQTDKGITGSSIHWREAMGNPLENPLRSSRSG